MVNNRATARATRQPTGDFHHPYNFVTAFPHHHDKLNNSDLGDAQKLKEIASHGKYHRDRWTGTIGVTLTTQTPLLIPDAATAREDNGHKYYDIRRTPNGKPYLLPTEIKVMLRTAYEIATNSRYSVFVEHQDRLAYRINAQGVDLIPARVERKGDKLYLRLMERKDIEIADQTQNLLGYAAKLPRYQRGVEKSNKKQPKSKKKNTALFPLKYPKGSLPQHGDRVWVRFNEFGEDTIRKSVITRIRPYESDSPPPGDGTWYKGWVFVSNENILGKKYERVFIEQEQNKEIEVTPEIAALWTELIKDYQKIHVKDLQQREEKNQSYDRYIGNKPGNTAWSRHIYEPGAEQFTEGTLCYVQFDNGGKIIALFLVVFSRRLYELSPAERVFGWVQTNPGKGERRTFAI